MNPEARGVTPPVQRVVQAALEARLKLDVAQTRARGEATDVAQAASESGIEIVIAFGGEGLINEIANGIAGSETSLAVIPGGTMNVFARNLGLPKDPLEATDRILRHAGTVDPIRVPLPNAGDRYFVTCCGCGFDAEAAARVEAHRSAKRRFGENYYYAAALATFVTSYFGKSPFLRCEGSFGVEEGVMAIGLNAATYSYLAGRPVRLGGSGLDEDEIALFLLHRLDYWRLPVYGLGALLTGEFGGQSLSVPGLEEFTVSGKAPFAVHVDGEPLAPADRVAIRAAASHMNVLV